MVGFRPRSLITAVVLGTTAVLVLSGCQQTGSSATPTSSPGSGGGSKSGHSTSDRSPTTTTAPRFTVAALPVQGATDVPPDQGVSVTLTGATIKSLTVTSPAGSVTGSVSPEGTGWMSAPGLLPSTSYHVDLTAQAGTKVEDKSWDFTTAAAGQVLGVKLYPGDNATVGVGMPVTVKLSAPVAAAERAVFESRLSVTSSPPVTGAWHWFSPTELHWRPQAFWPAHTQVSVAANVAGFGSGNGAVAVTNVATHWTVGDSHVSIVDSVKHVMAVATNGAPVRLFKVSTGQAKYPTHSGIHVVSEKKPVTVMDSATVGIPRNSPDGYYETVKWDVRISNSGEFVHAAPWSVKSQGRSNVSHGCVNVSDTDGQWFFNYSVPGDVVIVTGTPLQLQPTNGIGDWQIPWEQWAN